MTIRIATLIGARRLVFGAITAAVITTASASCKEEGRSDGAAADNGASATPAAAINAEPPKPKKKPSVRPKLDAFRPLLDEAARAEIDSGGLFVDLGTADQHKYTRGSWRTGWGENKQIDGISVVEGSDRRLHLDVLSTAEVAEIAVRARSAVAGQAATVWVDGERQGDIWLKPEWTVMRVPVTAGALAPGRHNVQLTFTKGGTPRAELDWVWLAREAGAEPPVAGVRVLPLRIGDQPKRALIAPTSRTYSFFLQPPAGASLVFDYASDAGVTFRVRAQADGAEPKTLFEGEGGAAWEEAQVDLGGFADQAIRLELVAEGGAGRSGWGEPVIMVPPSDSGKPAVKTALPGQPKNVVVILIDTVRAEVFEAVRPGNQIHTPAFDALAQDSTVFVNAYNNENWTKPSVATTLSGLYPSTHDAKKDESKLSDDVELISERLKQEGFATAGFVANGYVSDKFGFEQGWDMFRNYIRENRKSEAEYVYRDALAWLTEHKQKSADAPYFLYIQTIDPHVTYKVERPYTQQYFEQEYGGPLGPTIDATELQDLSKGKRNGSEADISWLKAVYHGEVTYHDEHMGKFIDQLKTMGALDDTLLVITNDHGEELQDHGKFGHGHTLFDELLRAPLLMRFPGLFPAAGRVGEVVENVDVAPTIIDALGFEPMSSADGSSLLPLVQDKPVQRPYYAVSEFLDGRRAVRVGDWKLMRSSSTWANLYNVSKDFDEDENLIDTAQIARRMCEVHLGEGLATPDKSKRQQDITIRRKFQAGEADIDPVMRKQLEALGYFGE